METTFITIHDLTLDAHILYCSDSIVDILGHTPDEVINRSCWDFFHPEELPLAKSLHSRGVNLDKAAVLSYCQIRNRQGQWVWCECCFTIVYNVMVVCTSIYRRGMASQKRAVEAPVVRRLFSSSPKDPRYHMLSHLSGKFSQTPADQTHEPRAALFLNRFTRTLAIMYATTGIEEIIGVPSEDIRGQSFYYCIQENCLDDAVRCMESAKGNDSIAYLRFWFRDPRAADPAPHDTDEEGDTDVSMTDAEADDESRGGGQWTSPLGSGSGPGAGSNEQSRTSHGTTSGGTTTSPETRSGSNTTSTGSSSVPNFSYPGVQPQTSAPNPDQNSTSGSSSDDSATPAVFDPAVQPATLPHESSSGTSPPTSPESTTTSNRAEPIELEAVVSCTSDGLVVILRRARPFVPQTVQEPPVQQPGAHQPAGLFAAPWAVDPVFVPARPGYQYHPIRPTALAPPPALPTSTYSGPGFAPRSNGPPQEDLWNAIRDVAVFAWALTGINGSLAEYATNSQQAAGESQPPEGFPIWESEKAAYASGGNGRSDSGSGGSNGGHQSGGSGGLSATPMAANPYPSPSDPSPARRT